MSIIYLQNSVAEKKRLEKVLHPLLPGKSIERKLLYKNVRTFFIIRYITHIIDEDKWAIEMEN